MKKRIKISLIVGALIIAVGLSAYYFISISKPWYVFERQAEYHDNLNVNAALFLDNDTLVLGDDSKTLVFFDLSSENPLDPINTISLNASVNTKISIVDNMVFTISANRFSILNITGGENHGEIYNYSSSNVKFSDFLVDGDVCYLTDYQQLYTFDISNYTDVQLTNNTLLTYGPDCHRLELNENFILVTDTYRGLKIFDLADPFHPTPAYRIDNYKTYAATPEIDASLVKIQGNLLLLTDDEDGLVIYQYYSPTQYEYLGSAYVSSGARALDSNGNFTYIAAGMAGISIFKTSETGNHFDLMRHVQYNNTQYAYNLVAYKDKVIIAHENGLTLLSSELGEGPNPEEQDFAIGVITGFLQVLAYTIIAVILIILVKKSKSL